MKGRYAPVVLSGLWTRPLFIFAVIIAVGFTPVGVRANDQVGRVAARIAQAEQLVRRALQSEARGESGHRDALLAKALLLDADFAPARWHSGNVRLDQQWLDIVEAQRQAAADPRFAQYQQLVDQYAGTLAGEVNLARWCQQQDLENQQRFHWARVLTRNPAYEEAQQALGVHLVAGQLLTSDEIKQQKEQKKKLHRLTKQLKVQIKRWLRQWQRATPGEREAVLVEIENWAEIKPLDQPLAIPQIEKDLSGRHGEISLAIVAALGRMADDRATMSLVRHAVLSPFAEVRRVAIDRLAERPLHDFVPTLMGQLKPPVESEYHVVPRRDGSVFYEHELYEQGPEQNRIKTFQGNFLQVGETPDYVMNLKNNWRTGTREVEIRVVSLAEKRRIVQEKRQRAIVRSKSYLAQAVNLEQRLARVNQSREERNERIAVVLASVTDQYLGDDPKSWWEWWRNYNELAPYEIPTYEQTYADRQYDRCTIPNYRTTPSCFPRGTPVWTMSGQKVIESVRKGDWVLAQDPETGQLAFKPVTATTFREPSPLIEIAVEQQAAEEQAAGGRALRATRGHPFWVDGKGWRMAKQLRVGDILHTVRGPLGIERVAETGQEEAYNLVVDGFGTFFVGAAGVLVHDNTIRQPTRSIVPGLAAR